MSSQDISSSVSIIARPHKKERWNYADGLEWYPSPSEYQEACKRPSKPVECVMILVRVFLLLLPHFLVSLFSAEILAALLITTTTRRRKKVVFCFAVVELHRRWALIKRRLTKRVMKNAKWSENICFIDMTNRRASPTHKTRDSTAKTATRFSCVSRTIASLEGGSIHIVRTIKDFEEKSCSADRAASL